ncbi:hypothetical protein HYFRA_00011405 [Hymenoscyphus fraxineus]|uniref:Alternative oxidase n=1 Tax=Hymenoscyphus fraxineus TaxID=746836 RepID=A0A9N9PKR0_9HELO|nr:hypothetical protein HYFRA_00011405 [Hymenoscyphus fraxineus]
MLVCALPSTKRDIFSIVSVFLATVFIIRFVILPISPSFYSAEPYWADVVNYLDVFDFEPADSEAIRKVCQSTEWNEKLIFTCDKSAGGVGNLRNSILNCVRYSIHAGAGLVIPRLVKRDSKDIAAMYTADTVEFDRIFDRPHFVESLRRSCPQLRVYNTSDDIPSNFPDDYLLPLEPEKDLVGFIPRNGSWQTEAWRGLLYTWLNDRALPGKEEEGPINSTTDYVVVALGRTYMQYPIYDSGEEFALNFGKILKFRSDARILATVVLKNLIRRYGIHPDIRNNVLSDAFYGIHLRTEKDSQQGWPLHKFAYSRYNKQAEYYLGLVRSSNTSVIYLASGDIKEVERFSDDAAAHNLIVTTKYDLLTGNDLLLLQNMAFDQQALVDYLVLLKSSAFAGVGHSSFAWNIALFRHQFAKQRDHLNGPQLLSDELSQIFGVPNMYPEYAPCLWP